MADAIVQSYLENFYRKHVFSGGIDGQVLVQDSNAASGAAWSATPTATDLTLTGQVKAADGAVGAPSYSFSGELTTGMYRGGAGDLRFSAAGGDKLRIAGTQVVVASSGLLAWGSSGISTADLFLTRDAANTFAQRNGTTAQASRVYNTFTDASNYERLDINWASNIVRIKSASAGTGTSRAMELGTLGTAGVFIQTNGTNRWQIDGGNGHLLASTDNSWDIGASGATRPRNVYIGTDITVGGSYLGSAGVQAGASSTFVWSARSRMSSQSDGTILLTNNALTDFTLLRFGGSTSSFPSAKRNGTFIDFRLADDSAYTGIGASTYNIGAVKLISGTAPTISSGFGTSPTIANNNGTAAFTVNVGTGGTATAGVVGLPTATTGWIVQVSAPGQPAHYTRQTASTTTTATLSNYNSAGTLTAWPASTVLNCVAMAY